MSKITIAFILTYFGGLIATIFIDGVYGIYLYELEYFLNPRIRWWYGQLPDLRYSFIIAIFILIGYIIRTNKYSHNRIFDAPQTKWVIALTILMGMVSFIAVWPERHQEIYIRQLKLVSFLFFVYKLIDTPQKFERLIWTFLIGSFYIGWVARITGRTGDDRLEGIGPTDSMDSNALAAVLLTSVPLLLFYIMEGVKKWQKIVALIFLAFILNAIILLNSRGSFLGIIASMLYLSYFVFIKRIKNFNYKIKMAIAVILGIFMFYYLADPAFWERMSTLKKVEETQEIPEGIEVRAAGGGRTYFWKKGIELAKKYPFGVGAWGYVFLSPQFIPESMLSPDLYGGTKGLRAAHSSWIQALTEYGYLGLIIFIGYLLSTFNLMRKVRKYLLKEENYYQFYQGVALTSGFIGFLVACSFLDMVNAEIMYWFPAFMACFANIYLYKNSKKY